jgi:hypothetical protein
MKLERYRIELEMNVDNIMNNTCLAKDYKIYSQSCLTRRQFFISQRNLEIKKSK